MTGLFITFEGGDGAGESTQTALLAEWLTDRGRVVLVTREPHGTPLGMNVRELIQHYEEDPPSPRSEALCSMPRIAPTTSPRSSGRRSRWTRSCCRTANLELAAEEPARFLVLDASLPPEDLTIAIRSRVAALIGGT